MTEQTNRAALLNPSLDDGDDQPWWAAIQPVTTGGPADTAAAGDPDGPVAR